MQHNDLLYWLVYTEFAGHILAEGAGVGTGLGWAGHSLESIHVEFRTEPVRMYPFLHSQERFAHTVVQKGLLFM